MEGRKASRMSEQTYPISLNAEQLQAAKEWAADDRLWTTQETVEFNLTVFARKILSAQLSEKDAEIRSLCEEIAVAREECPAVRQERFASASLLDLVRQTVSFGFLWQSRAEASSRSLLVLKEGIAKLIAKYRQPDDFDSLDRHGVADELSSFLGGREVIEQIQPNKDKGDGLLGGQASGNATALRHDETKG